MTTARSQVAAALLLALAAGAVDAVSFVVLHHTFTANMTGNTTELGLAAGRASAATLVPLAAAVVAFIFAIALGTAAIELATRLGLRATAAPAFVVEAALIAVFMADGPNLVRNGTIPDHHAGGFYLLLAVAVVAMGIQTATLAKALQKTVRTTYVSGLITTFTQELVNLAVPRPRGGPSYLRDELGLGSRAESLRRVALHVSVWGCFIGGAAWGGYGQPRWSTWPLALPVGVLLVAAVVDLLAPLHETGG